jgi:hypothetical protein
MIGCVIRNQLLRSLGLTESFLSLSQNHFFLNHMIGLETKVSAATDLVRAVKPSRRVLNSSRAQAAG